VQVRKAAQIVQNVVTYVVIVAVDNPNGKLLPGMTANVKLIIAEKPSALKVPNAALRFRPSGAEGKAKEGKPKSERAGRVWTPGPGGELQPLALSLGLTDGSATEILDGGIKEGQEVVVGLAAGGGKNARKSGAPVLKR